MSIWLVSLLVILGLLSIPLIKALKYNNWSIKKLKRYFSKDGKGKGSISGVRNAILFVVIALTIAFFSEQARGDWEVPHVAYIWAGLDYTKDLSPQCEEDGADNRLTSDLGVGYQVLKYDDDLVISIERSHHSCAINIDKESYDAWGVKATWYFNLF